MPNALIVEDNDLTANLVGRAMTESGYQPTSCKLGAHALDAARATPFDVALIDYGLPDMSGSEVCIALRSQGLHFPVLIITANDTIRNRVHCLELGADDYLSKPFHVDELQARVSALVRRATTYSSRTPAQATLFPKRAILVASGRNIPLSVKETVLLQKLADSNGEIVSKVALAESLANTRQECGNLLQVMIHNLRKKLAEHDADPLIVTVRGAGYRLAAPVQVSGQR